MAKDDPILAKLTLLERLEEIREELDELGIDSFEALNARIEELEAEVGDIEDEDLSRRDGSV